MVTSRAVFDVITSTMQPSTSQCVFEIRPTGVCPGYWTRHNRIDRSVGDPLSERPTCINGSLSALVTTYTHTHNMSEALCSKEVRCQSMIKDQSAVQHKGEVESGGVGRSDRGVQYLIPMIICGIPTCILHSHPQLLVLGARGF